MDGYTQDWFHKLERKIQEQEEERSRMQKEIQELKLIVFKYDNAVSIKMKKLLRK